MKLTKLTAALLAALTACSAAAWSGVSVPRAELTASAADTAPEAVPDWVPTDYNSALVFSRMYGETLVKDGYVCVLFRVQLGGQDLEDDREHDFNPIREMKGDVLREVRRTVFRPDKAEDGAADVYRLAVYSVEFAGSADVELDDTRNLLNPNLVTYSFAFNENKELIKQTYTPRNTGITEAPDWVPADYGSAEQLYKACGSISETQMYGGAVKIANDKKSVCVLYEVSLADDGEDYRMKIESSGDALGLIMSGTYKPSDRSASDKEYKIAVYCGMNEGQSCVLLDDGWTHNRPIAPVYYLSVDANRQITDTTVKPVGISDLPDWVPKDYESALDFRNTYGTTRVQDNGVCVVSYERLPDWDDESSGFRIIGNGAALREILQYSFQPEEDRDMMIPHRVHVSYFEGVTAGESGITFVAPGLDGLVKYHSYTFRVSDSLTVEETDIYKWLPDCYTEYRQFVEKKGDISVVRSSETGEEKDCICVCVTDVSGTAYQWKETQCLNLEKIRSSGCSMIETVPLAGGSVNTVYVYQPIGDGRTDVSWGLFERMNTSASQSPRDEMAGSFYVLDGGKTVLGEKDARFRLVDYYSGAPLDIDSFRSRYAVDDATEPFWGWVEIVECPPASRPAYDKKVSFLIKANSYIFENANIPYSWDQYTDYEAGLDTSVLPQELELPADGTSIVCYENGSVDITFRLKARSANGDVNSDGALTIADAVLFSKWLLCEPGTVLKTPAAADLNSDGRLDVRDLSLMKRELMNQAAAYLLLNVSYGGWGVDGHLLGAGEHSVLFPIAEGDTFYEQMNGRWVKNQESSEYRDEPLIRIDEIHADSIMYSRWEINTDGTMKQITETVPYNTEYSQRSSGVFIICDGINYFYSIKFIPGTSDQNIVRPIIID